MLPFALYVVFKKRFIAVFTCISDLAGCWHFQHSIRKMSSISDVSPDFVSECKSIFVPTTRCGVISEQCLSGFTYDGPLRLRKLFYLENHRFLCTNSEIKSLQSWSTGALQSASTKDLRGFESKWLQIPARLQRRRKCFHSFASSNQSFPELL